MAKKESLISINKLESTVNKHTIEVPMVGRDDTVIVIRPTLSLKNMMQFVENVVSSCVDAETGVYTPEIKEFAIRSEILTKYANFNLPSNAEKQYELLYCTGVVEQVKSKINNAQFFEIKRSIDARIDHELKKIESTLASKANELISQVEVLLEQLGVLFGGINSEDFNGVVKKLADMDDMTEESLAKAVLGVQREQIESSNNSASEVLEFRKN